jgi:hypothetical protein
LREFSVWHSGLIAREPAREHLEHALSLTPTDASKWTKLGAALIQKDPDAAAKAFRRAISLNTFETDAMLGLAVLAETRGDQASAEALYVQATQSSRRLKPALSLAAFYARVGRMDDFWRTATAAAAIDKSDVATVFQLAEEAGADPDRIPTLLNLRTDHALATYVRLSAANDRPVALAQAAMRLPATQEHQPDILMACDRLIAYGAAEAAVELWNRAGVFEKLDVAGGRSLTNPSFVPNTVSGFNWRFYKNAGIEIRPGTAGLSIDFSGEQRQQVLVLEQIVPLLDRRNYRLSVELAGGDLSKTDGLAWQVQCMPWRSTIASARIASSLANTTSIDFSTPAGCNLGSALLVYRRQPGTVRISGTLSLRSAALELLP